MRYTPGSATLLWTTLGALMALARVKRIRTKGRFIFFGGDRAWGCGDFDRIKRIF